MYFITAIDSISQFSLAKVNRCFGYEETQERAHQRVITNSGNIQECLYDFVVIEHIPDGIHPLVIQEWWYKWDAQTRNWCPLQNAPKPFIGITNWAIG